MNAHSTANKASLASRLNDRKREISNAKDYVLRTQELFEEFGSAELKTSHARFPELLNALDSSDIRMVVLGEFSRGKSFLLNSLLGTRVLPTATQTTTAINTFLKALPEGEGSQYIMVHWQDKKRPPQRVEWTGQDALQRWGTELENTNADMRREVDHIELFLSHPLLNDGLVLVDTPGLQTIVQHHEAITRKAIAEAHIALFVQSADQLGGNQTEWDFMEGTLKNNFRKFITVINKWDLVLEPEDEPALSRSPEENERRSLQTVKDNFARVLRNSPNAQAELEALTNADHLMGVSAKWAQSKHESERQRCGIDRLHQRIVSMVASGEAVQQILLKPLQQLSSVQVQLLKGIRTQLDELNSTDSLEVRRMELQNREHKIALLKMDATNEAALSREYHTAASDTTADEVRLRLVTPMKHLKSQVQDKVTESHVRRLLVQAQQAGREPKIGLPPELDKALQQVQTEVAESWERQKALMVDRLNDLRRRYLNNMKKHAQAFDAKLDSTAIQLPALDINLNCDFSDLLAHQKQMEKLQNSLAEAEREHEEADRLLAQGKISEAQATARKKQAEANTASARRQMENMGPPPEPRTYNEEVEVKRSGFTGWLKDIFTTKYETRRRTDDSNVRAYRENEAILKQDLAAQAKIEEQRQKDAAELTNQRELREQIARNAQKELDKKERELREAQFRQKELENNMVNETVRKLRDETVAQLDNAMAALEQYAKETVKTTFMDQAELLKAVIDEKLMEPLEAEMAQKQAIQELLRTGEAAIQAKRASLERGLKDVEEVLQMTRARLQATH